MAKDSQKRFDSPDMKELLAQFPPDSPEESDRRVGRALTKVRQGIAIRDLADFSFHGLWWSFWGILKPVMGLFSSEKR